MVSSGATIVTFGFTEVGTRIGAAITQSSNAWRVHMRVEGHFASETQEYPEPSQGTYMRKRTGASMHTTIITRDD